MKKNQYWTSISNSIFYDNLNYCFFIIMKFIIRARIPRDLEEKKFQCRCDRRIINIYSVGVQRVKYSRIPWFDSTEPKKIRPKECILEVSFFSLKLTGNCYVLCVGLYILSNNLLSLYLEKKSNKKLRKKKMILKTLMVLVWFWWTRVVIGCLIALLRSTTIFQHSTSGLNLSFQFIYTFVFFSRFSLGRNDYACVHSRSSCIYKLT